MDDTSIYKVPGTGETFTPIPRNYGVGFGAFTVNMRISRAWGFGESTTGNNNAARPPAGGGGGRGFGGGGFGGGGGGRGPGGFFGGAATNRKYTITASLEARNLLNSVNPGTPVGIFTSPQFGQPQSLAGGGGGGPYGGFGVSQTANRRLQLQLRFTF